MTGTTPLIPACRLWKKQSSAGQSYLVGRLGGLRVLIMANKERQGDDEHTHILLITAAPDASATQTPAPATLDAPPDARPAWAKAKARNRQRHAEAKQSQIADDPLPF